MFITFLFLRYNIPEIDHKEAILLSLGPRGGTKSLIFHDFCAYQCVLSWACPHTVAVLKKKLRDPQRISSSNIIVSIADHSHTVFAWGSQGITLENRHQSLLCKVYGDKSDDTAFLSEHVIILYLLCLDPNLG